MKINSIQTNLKYNLFYKYNLNKSTRAITLVKLINLRSICFKLNCPIPITIRFILLYSYLNGSFRKWVLTQLQLKTEK